MLVGLRVPMPISVGANCDSLRELERAGQGVAHGRPVRPTAVRLVWFEVMRLSRSLP